MKTYLLLSVALLAAVPSIGFGQHSDLEFGYDDLANPTAFEIENDQFTSDGILFFESEFELLDPFDDEDFSSDEPGFTTSAAEGLLVNPLDQIWLRAFDAAEHSAFGVGYVNYYNPLTDQLEASGRLEIAGNSSSTTDLVLNGASIESGDNPQFIDRGDSSGDVHDHVLVDLLDDTSAPFGAYGVLFQLQSDFDVADGTMDLSSDPFWIIWNHGLDEDEFENQALARFGIVSVPEPSGLGLMIMCSAFIGFRRKRS